MEDMVRVVAAAALAAALAPAQVPELFEKAPPEIDSALRQRVAAFYQAHVEGRFRVADGFVAEDSKDIFFEADKRRFKKFEISRITYSDNYTRARVLITGDTEMPMGPAGVVPVKLPLLSNWKVEGGKWFWYVESPSKEQRTPFGVMKPGPAGSTTPPGLPAGPSVADVLKAVELSRNEVVFRSSQPSRQEIEVTNRMPGAVRLAAYCDRLAGLRMRLEQSELKPNETTRIVFDYKPAGQTASKELAAELTVEPTGRRMPIRVRLLDGGKYR